MPISKYGAQHSYWLLSGLTALPLQTNFVSFHIVIIPINTLIIKFFHYQILVFFISFSSTSNFVVLIWFLLWNSIATLEFHQVIFPFSLVKFSNPHSLKPKSEVFKEDYTEWKFDQTVFCFVLIQTTNFILSHPWVDSYLKLPLIFLIHSLIDFLSNYFHPMYLIIIRDEPRTKCLHPYPSELCGSCPSLINTDTSKEASQGNAKFLNVTFLPLTFSVVIWHSFGQGWLLEKSIAHHEAPCSPQTLCQMIWAERRGKDSCSLLYSCKCSEAKSLQLLSSVHYSINATLSERNSLSN